MLGLVSFAGLGVTIFLPGAAIAFGIVGLRREPHGRSYAVTGLVLGAWGLVNGIALLGLLLILPGLADSIGEILNELDIDGTRGPRGL